MYRILISVFLLGASCRSIGAQDADPAARHRGSETAKNGFRNEDEIRDKFNDWEKDKDARLWLRAMKHRLGEIQSVTAKKPHGYKADVEVAVKTQSGEKVEGISIKLVSTKTGFNQIDKRWLKTYAAMWKMPPGIVKAMQLYLGETPPTKPGRHAERMYLNELPPDLQKDVMDFFTKHKDEIVSDLLAGDGDHAADWFMVTLKTSSPPRWCLRSLSDTIQFYAQGDVVMTRAGNLKIGRISMQRKGGDNGRETAKMLQFKINPVQLFEAK